MEIGTFAGTFGIFLSLFLLFMRFLPMIAMSEIKIVTPAADPHAFDPDSSIGIEGHHGADAAVIRAARRSLTMAEYRKVYGLGAEFDSAAELLRAAEKVRDAGFTQVGFPHPFPGPRAGSRHGHGQILALRARALRRHHRPAHGRGPDLHPFLQPSIRVIVHGKPYTWATLPAFFPIMFELTVLFSAFTVVFTLLIMSSSRAGITLSSTGSGSAGHR